MIWYMSQGKLGFLRVAEVTRDVRHPGIGSDNLLAELETYTSWRMWGPRAAYLSSTCSSKTCV